MPFPRKPWIAAFCALLCGAALRAVFIVHHPRVAGDALVYGDLAHNLLAHHIFGLTEGTIRPTLIRLPGYPFFLAACFVVFGEGRYLPVLWVQAGVDLLSCALLAGLGARLWGERARVATLWLACLCPFTANYTAVAITETLSNFCVVLAFYGFEQWRSAFRLGQAGERSLAAWAAVLGLALGGAVLLRPDQGLLAAAVLPAMLWTVLRTVLRTGRERGRPAGLSFAAATLVFVFPLLLWGARNWRVFHVVQPLAPRYANDPGEIVSFGFQRWYRSWAIDFESSLNVYWPYDGAVLHLTDLPDRAFDSPAQKEETAAVYRRYNREQAATPETDAAFDRLAKERIAAHPFRYSVVLPVSRLLNMWLRPRTELMKLPVAWWRFTLNPLGSALALLYATLNALYLLLAGIGLLRWKRESWSGGPLLAAAMLGFVVLRCALLLTLDNSEPRYTLECFPVVFLLGGLALARQVPSKLSA